MCGVFGYFGKPSKKTVTALTELCRLNQERGRDSTGVAVSNGKQFSFYKDAVCAEVFLKQPQTQYLIHGIKKESFINFIGHTRQATKGEVNQQNAHPFKIGQYVFAHNGNIHNFDELQRNYKTEYLVDSQIIGHLLNLHEPVKVFDELIQGWFTVPYFELDKLTQLNIAKHYSPLAFATTSDGIFYSSLKFHLKQALLKADIKAGVGETQGAKLYKFYWIDGQVKRDKFKLYPKSYNYQSSYSYDYNQYSPAKMVVERQQKLLPSSASAKVCREQHGFQRVGSILREIGHERGCYEGVNQQGRL